MIKRDRALCNIPQSLLSQKARNEYNDVANHYNSGTKDEYLKYKIYKSEDVKEALQKLFFKKCAYCESKYDTVVPVDIEHFRPKGKVKLENSDIEFRPGYWWLAGEWTNLLPSCPRCNRLNTYKIGGISKTLGKGNFFPILIRNNQQTELHLSGVRHEIPLLIDPTIEEPSTYLRFHFEETRKINTSLVTSTASEGFVHLKAETSIQYYALNRPDLVKARIEELNKMRFVLLTIERSIQLIENRTDLEERNEVRKEIIESFNELFEIYLNKKESYFQAKWTYFTSWIQKYEIEEINFLLKWVFPKRSTLPLIVI